MVQTENDDDFGYAQIEADELKTSYTTGEGMRCYVFNELELQAQSLK